MRPALVALTALALSGCGCSASSGRYAPDSPPTRPATTDAGMIVGVELGAVHAYLGVPYAAPPVDQLRWRPPQPPEPWTGVRQAQAFGPACPQPKTFWARFFGQQVGATSEDCLTLNVWAPVAGPAGKRAVLVWLHGGGFQIGSGALRLYDGARLAKRGVVVVTLNYRLGRLGFFAPPALIDEAQRGGEPFGNYGLLDQIEALRWVQRNIAAFGGDASQVTVVGQSAGGRSVNLLMVAPAARGLFARAISMSGPVSEPLRHATQSRAGKEPVSKTDAAFIADRSPADVTRLREVPASSLVDWLEEQGSAGFGPFIDDAIIPDDPATVFARGGQHDVPLMVGVTDYEGRLYLDLGGDPEQIRASLDPWRSEATKLYGLTGDAGKDEGELVRAWEDGKYLASARFVARHASRKNAATYLYSFTYVPEFRRGDERFRGVPHGFELPFVFDNLYRTRKASRYREPDRMFASLVADYWVAFAKTGDPNGAGRPYWPRYEVDKDDWFVLGTPPRVQPQLRAPLLDFHERRMQQNLGLEPNP